MTEDSYDPIRKLLPRGAQLGFVFDYVTVEGHTSAIYFVEESSKRIRKATLTNGKLTTDMQGSNPMMDDGMDPETEDRIAGKVSNEGVTRLFNEKFRAATPMDRVILDVLIGKTPDPNTKVAIGLDLVFTRIDWRNNTIFARRDWTLADTIIALMRDYPVMSKFANDIDMELNLENVEYVLKEMTDIFSQSHNSQYAVRVISSTWHTLNKNLAICQYNPQLADVYAKTAQASKNYLLGRT